LLLVLAGLVPAISLREAVPSLRGHRHKAGDDKSGAFAAQ